MELLADQVHIWQVALRTSADQVRQLARLLSADERDRAAQFRLELHRDRFVVGRGVMRVLLGRYLDTSPDRLQFQYGAHGKPALLPTASGKTVQFNVAHSEDLALLAVAGDRPVGVDLEKLRPVPDAARLAQRFFAPSEHAALCALAAAEQEAAFFRYWTCKEAYLKAIGCGLAHALDRVTVDFSGAIPQLLAIDSPAAQWCLQELTTDSGYAAAVVTSGLPPALCRFTWRF